ncbi:hypothetical protein ACNF42_06665 [Cuniculiplasma sp. SKW3]|uniref:hypothetical protein n=1 Tax=Cuniculiplasma sp. SKW3 TaxID=3400170 RepID=UPI003FD10AD6
MTKTEQNETKQFKPKSETEKTEKGEAKTNKETKIFSLRDGEELIPDFQTYNPLYDFIAINGKHYAIWSLPIKKMIEVKKGDQTEIKWINAWKTFYTNGIEIKVMENDKIDGNTVKPDFTADEFLNNSKSLLHRRSELNPRRETIQKLFGYVKNVIGKYVSLPDNDLTLVSCWIIAAHFHRVFPQFPPLIFGKAGSNAGGTTALMTTSLLPYPMQIFNQTEAVIFRMANYGLSLLIDEVDPRDKDKIDALNLILDGSFSKDSTIPRATGKNFGVEVFKPYGPKCLIDPYMAIVKSSTVSRSVKTWLKNDPKKSINLGAKDFVSYHKDLVDMLYGSFIFNAHIVRKAYDEITDYSGRERQAYAPVIAIANLAGVHDQVVSALRLSIESTEIAREGDPIKFVLFSLYNFLLEQRELIHKDIELTSFTLSKDKMSISIEFSTLRRILTDRVSEVQQIDESTSGGKREWKKIPEDYKKQFQSMTFNQIIKGNLPKFVKQVRGERLGLKLETIGTENMTEVDPVLDELEKILRIGEEFSYKKSDNKDIKESETEYKQVKNDDEIIRLLK